MVAEPRARSVRRGHMDDHTRITLLEDDQDVHELAQRDVANKLDKVLNRLMWTAIGFAGSTILLAVNIIYQTR